MARKKGRYFTCNTKKTKLSKKKSIEVIYKAINYKRMNIVRVQKAQGTDTTTKVKGDKRIFTTLKKTVHFLLVVETLVTSEAAVQTCS